MSKEIEETSVREPVYSYETYTQICGAKDLVEVRSILNSANPVNYVQSAKIGIFATTPADVDEGYTDISGTTKHVMVLALDSRPYIIQHARLIADNARALYYMDADGRLLSSRKTMTFIFEM
ncbi:MAG: hypothetical protein PHF83_05430 [Candidatus Methanomethylophilus sp.]|nr:hypothetical protein [Methanomethylophilus sp.]